MGSPSLLDAQAGRVLERHNDLAEYLSNHAIGGIVSDGGTTQSSGASTALNFDVDNSAVIQALIDGEVHILAAGTDLDSDAGVSFGATSGKEVLYAVVLESGSGNDTPAGYALAGDPADVGEGVRPTDAEIDAGLGHGNWAPLALVLVTRTADTTVTVEVDNSWRYRSVEDHTSDLAESESAYQTAAGVP